MSDDIQLQPVPITLYNIHDLTFYRITRGLHGAFAMGEECRRSLFRTTGPVLFGTCIFSSPEPKARVSYCHSALSVVRPSVRPSVRLSGVRKLFTFSTSSPEPLDGF